jgi:hypothetical protein
LVVSFFPLSTQCSCLLKHNPAQLIHRAPVIPFFLIPTFTTCDGDEGKTHEVSPLFTFVPLSPAPHALLTISHHCESSTITDGTKEGEG